MTRKTVLKFDPGWTPAYKGGKRIGQKRTKITVEIEGSPEDVEKLKKAIKCRAEEDFDWKEV